MKIRSFLSLIVATSSIVCFALSPQARAVCQEGCFDNFNTAFGGDAFENNAGLYNTAIGFGVLSNTTGSSNTATGAYALPNNTTGFSNTASGASALRSNTTGFDNTAAGFTTLYLNTSGYENTATGHQALWGNSAGYWNTATGSSSLGVNADGYYNTATGVSALGFNEGGNINTATGVQTLEFNTTGNNNTADGAFALNINTTGSNNTADGLQALLNNTTGNNNIAVGDSAGINLTTGSNNIDIGNSGVAAEAGTIRIGTAGSQTAAFIAGIRETPIAAGGALAVGISVDGQLGVRASSTRFKEAIKPMGKSSEAIFSLRPVSFRYKKALDPKAVPQFGLVAEEVVKVDPDLVLPDSNGKPLTVRYDEVNAMLLNEFLKEHKKVGEQEADIAQLKSAVNVLMADLKAQAAQIQQVNARLEASKARLRVATND